MPLLRQVAKHKNIREYRRQIDSFLRGWLPHIGKAQMACNYCFPKNSSYYSAPVGDQTKDFPPP